MRRVFLAVLLLLLTSLSILARTKVQGIASQGGQVVVTSGISSTTKVVKSYPGCTVTVYFAGTTALVSIFSDNSGTPKSNPFTTGSDASYFFYVDDGNYDIRFSGTGISSPFTISDVLVGSSGGGSTGVESYNGRTGAVVPIANDIRYIDLDFTGSSLSSIGTRSASDLSSGTLPDARFPTTLPALNGSLLTNLNASALAAGTIPDVRFPSTLPTLNGSQLTNLNASAISIGTLADGRLSTNIPKLDATNTFQTANYFNTVVGIATVTPRRPLDILSISQPQLRLSYADNSAFADFLVNSAGTLILNPIGSINFNANGKQIDPALNYDQNLGQLSKKYLSLHAAELVVETLVSQNTLATIGGRVLIAPSTPLIADLAPAATTIDVKYNNLTNGDRVYLESGGSVEFLAIASTPTTITGGFRYTVTRNLDGTGANQWFAGDAIVNTGQTGSGFIDLYSTSGVKSATQVGPTIVGNVRNSATYNDWTESWAIGNLKGIYGYAVDTYGTAFGKYVNGTSHITIDAGNGIRFFSGLSTVTGVWDAGGILIGQAAAGQNNFQFNNSTGVLAVRNNTTARMQINADGSGFIANSLISWNASGSMTIQDASLKLVGSSAFFSIGSTPPTSASAGTGIWIDRNGIVALSSNVVTTVLSSTGIQTIGSGSFQAKNAAGNPIGIWTDAASGGAVTSHIQVNTTGFGSTIGRINLEAGVGNQSDVVTLQINGGSFGAGDARLFDNGGSGTITGLTIGADAAPAVMLDVRGETKTDSVQWNTGIKPTCNSGNRGKVWYVAGGASVLDTFEVCRKDASDSYSWVTLF